MGKLMNLTSRDLCAGALGQDDEVIQKMEEGAENQRTNDLDVLLDEAQEAQHHLRRKIAPETMWTTDQEHGHGARVQRAQGKQYPSNVDETILLHIDEAYDPGVKTRERIDEKANFKYKDEDGLPRFDRVKDISRVAIQFHTIASLMNALPRMSDAFDIIELENRFSNPTALGWMDITLLVRIPLDEARYQIAEVQAQLTDFALERLHVHKHYKLLRTAIPAMGVLPAHVDAVQRTILDVIDGRPLPSSHRCPSKSSECPRAASAGKTNKSHSSMTPVVCTELPGVPDFLDDSSGN